MNETGTYNRIASHLICHTPKAQSRHCTRCIDGAAVHPQILLSLVSVTETIEEKTWLVLLRVKHRVHRLCFVRREDSITHPLPSKCLAAHDDKLVTETCEHKLWLVNFAVANKCEKMQNATEKSLYGTKTRARERFFVLTIERTAHKMTFIRMETTITRFNWHF